MISNELLKRKILNCVFSGKSFDDNCNFERVIDNFDIVGGSQPPKSEFSKELKNNYVRLYQTRDYGNKPIPVFVNKNDVSKFTVKGDILLARYGGSLGKVFIAENGAYNVAMAKVVIIDKQKWYKKFVYYYFLSDYYQKFTKTLSKMAQAGFNKNDLSELQIIVPIYSEQMSIVEKIDSIFKLINQKENNDQEKSKLKEILKKKVLDEAIHGKLVQNDVSLKPIDVDEISDNKPYVIPSNWKWTKLENIFSFSQGIQIDLDKQFTICNNEHPLQFLRIVDFTQNNNDIRYVSKDYSNHYINKNDLAIVRYGASAGYICFGKEGVLANNLFELNKKIDINERFYMYAFKSEYFQKAMIPHSLAMPALKFSTLYNIKIPVPPIEQQKKIVDKIEDIFQLIDQL
jgi:type I restriction enzyme S subunit